MEVFDVPKPKAKTVLSDLETKWDVIQKVSRKTCQFGIFNAHWHYRLNPKVKDDTKDGLKKRLDTSRRMKRFWKRKSFGKKIYKYGFNNELLNFFKENPNGIYCCHDIAEILNTDTQRIRYTLSDLDIKYNAIVKVRRDFCSRNKPDGRIHWFYKLNPKLKDGSDKELIAVESPAYISKKKGRKYKMTEEHKMKIRNAMKERHKLKQEGKGEEIVIDRETKLNSITAVLLLHRNYEVDTETANNLIYKIVTKKE